MIKKYFHPKFISFLLHKSTLNPYFCPVSCCCSFDRFKLMLLCTPSCSSGSHFITPAKKERTLTLDITPQDTLMMSAYTLNAVINTSSLSNVKDQRRRPINLHCSRVSFVETQSINRKGWAEKKTTMRNFLTRRMKKRPRSRMFTMRSHRNYLLSLAAQLRGGFGFSERSENICPLQPPLKY